jgi:hypothetical protein
MTDENGGEFTPPASQEALDQIINAAVARTHKRYEGFDDYKAKAEQFDQLQTTDGDALEQAREEGRAEVRSILATERVNAAFDKALAGRALSANALLNFDRAAFMKGPDGADVDAITEWVNANSTEIKTTSEVVPGSGDRTPPRNGGSVDEGRDLYSKTRKKSA